jgi:S1-C subfamily serine protease
VSSIQPFTLDQKAKGEKHMRKSLSGTICSICAALVVFAGCGSAALSIASQAPSGDSVCILGAANPPSPAVRADRPTEKTAGSADEVKTKHFQDLLNGGTTGTGWPVSPGYVVTNSHVAQGTQIMLLSSEGREIPAWPVLRDESNDVVLLEVKDPSMLPPALPLASSKARLGASVFTIGFPRVDFMGKTPKLSTGVISGENGLRDDPASVQTTVPIQPGNSGGPLLNMKGEVVGVVKSMLGIRDTASGSLSMLQTTSCALKVKGVQDLLHQVPRKDAGLDILPNRADDLESLADRIRDSVLLVISK